MMNNNQTKKEEIIEFSIRITLPINSMRRINVLHELFEVKNKLKAAELAIKALTQIIKTIRIGVFKCVDERDDKRKFKLFI